MFGVRQCGGKKLRHSLIKTKLNYFPLFQINLCTNNKEIVVALVIFVFVAHVLLSY